jgi:hypothetical protein
MQALREPHTADSKKYSLWVLAQRARNSQKNVEGQMDDKGEKERGKGYEGMNLDRTNETDERRGNASDVRMTLAEREQRSTVHATLKFLLEELPCIF